MGLSCSTHLLNRAVDDCILIGSGGAISSLGLKGWLDMWRVTKPHQGRFYCFSLPNGMFPWFNNLQLLTFHICQNVLLSEWRTLLLRLSWLKLSFDWGIDDNLCLENEFFSGSNLLFVGCMSCCPSKGKFTSRLGTWILFCCQFAQGVMLWAFLPFYFYSQHWLCT